MAVADQPHAHLYRGLPPARSRWWRRLRVSAVGVVTVSAVAVPLFTLAYATSSAPPSTGGGFFGGGWFAIGPVLTDRYVLMASAGSFIVGGVLGFTLPRRWWSTLALYVFGFAISGWLIFVANAPI